MSHILVFHKTKGSKAQRWQVCFFMCFLEPRFNAAGMNILFWILWFCFNDRLRDSQNYKATLKLTIVRSFAQDLICCPSRELKGGEAVITLRVT